MKALRIIVTVIACFLYRGTGTNLIGSNIQKRPLNLLGQKAAPVSLVIDSERNHSPRWGVRLDVQSPCSSLETMREFLLCF